MEAWYGASLNPSPENKSETGSEPTPTSTPPSSRSIEIGSRTSPTVSLDARLAETLTTHTQWETTERLSALFSGMLEDAGSALLRLPQGTYAVTLRLTLLQVSGQSQAAGDRETGTPAGEPSSHSHDEIASIAGRALAEKRWHQ